MWLSDFEKSLIIGTIGTPLYLDIFLDECFPIQIVYVNHAESIDIPITDNPKLGYQIISSLDGGNHAMSLFLDNINKRYKLFDSSRLINWESHKIIDLYLQDLGYISESEICSIRYLPQIKDSLCILWSLFLLQRECKQLLIYITSANERSIAFRDFQLKVWQLALKYIQQYYMFQQHIGNLSLNNRSFIYDDIRKSFTAAFDKDIWLKENMERFQITTSIDRTPYEALFLMYMLEYVYGYSYELGKLYAINVKNKLTMQEIIDEIPLEIPSYYRSYLIYMIISIFILDTKNSMDIFYGRNSNIPEKYVYKYRKLIIDLIQLKGIDIPGNVAGISDYRLMELIDIYAGLNQELKNSLRLSIFS